MLIRIKHFKRIIACARYSSFGNKYAAGCIYTLFVFHDRSKNIDGPSKELLYFCIIQIALREVLFVTGAVYFIATKRPIYIASLALASIIPYILSWSKAGEELEYNNSEK